MSRRLLSGKGFYHSSGAAWTPASLGANLIAWFKDPDLNTTRSGSNVTQWNDSSSNGYNLTPNFATAPVYSATGLNSKPAVIFTAANSDRLVSTGTVAWGTGALGSAFMLGSFTANSNDGGGLGLNDSSFNPFRFVLAKGSATTGIEPQFGGSVGTLQPAAINTVLRMGSVFDGAHATTYVNNVANGTPLAVTAAFTNSANIGFNLNAGTFAYDGPVREMIFTNIALSSTDRANLDTYLASRA